MSPLARQPSTRPHPLSSNIFISSAHHDGRRLWLIASPVATPSPNRTMNIHQNTMGDAPTRWFGRNQPGGRAIGWVLPKQQPTIQPADSMACGNTRPKPNDESSSKHYGRRTSASVWPESANRVSNWVCSAEAKKTIFFHTTTNHPLG